MAIADPIRRLGESHEAHRLAEARRLGTAVDQAKTEIRADIDRGVVPASVVCFAELHEYVDANEYGGLCDIEGDDGRLDDAYLAFANEVQAEVDAWLLAGRP